MSKRQRRKKMERRLAKNPDRLHDHMTNQARTDRLLDAMRVEGRADPLGGHPAGRTSRCTIW